MRRRVIKLGGSLLDFDNLRSAFRQWREAQPLAFDVLVVGGGDLAEAIRKLDQRFLLGEEAAHWLCVRAMGVSARLAAALWSEFTLATRLDELLQRMNGSQDAVAFDAEDFLLREELSLSGVVLAHTWTVTSDSIAARVAEVIQADELVLLKSSLPDRSPMTCAEASESGYVDPFFPTAARPVSRIRAVNLRSADLCESRLTAED